MTLLAVMAGLAALPLWAQTAVPFGGLEHDASLPVEITADSLEVDQADGAATFVGNVVIGQGSMRLSAGKVRVEYAAGDDATGQIEKLTASGGVTLVNVAEAAEAAQAVYTIDSGSITMSGSVILTQGRNALSADRMVVNLNSGQARLDGRVKTILQSGGN
jgi:lipopolysaccharide export system protein LptA